jgi:hypothetical protein
MNKIRRAEMIERRSQNPADQFKELTDLINDEIRKLEECLAAISEYSSKLHAVATDSTRRLIGRS